jgi:hypothetical protein
MSRLLDYKDYYHMPGQDFQPLDVIELRLVLVLGYGNDYAIYYAPEADGWDARRIAHEGDKLDAIRGPEVAKRMFSTAVHGRHYRG